jgi:choline dehydrogenase-like flavoprotein
MDERRRTTLRSVVATFAPADARLERVTALAAEALDSVTPKRRAEAYALLDLLDLPMRLNDDSRTGVLKLFALSPVPKLRTAFATLKRLALFLAYAESAPGDENPTWARIGYPGPRGDGGFDDVALPYATARAGQRIEADVVVIGSGAGGGVAAAAFARAGKRVVVLEAGGAYDARTFTQREISTADLYLDRGLTASEDLGVAILAGATVGGGTTVNWCTSFRLAGPIAAEWEAESGIEGLGAQLAPHYAFLESLLGTAPVASHNANNRKILEGARALGLHADAMPRNAPADCGDGCGYCGYGCAYGKKRSTPRAFLPEIAAHGGALYANAHAVKVELSGARASGVVVSQSVAPDDVRAFEVVADTVVVSGGALRTPGILARSGIRHPFLGKRLFLHPVAGCIAEYPEPVDPWIGPMQSAYSDAYNYRGGNYGAKIEVAPTHPGIAALALPWQNRGAHAALMNRARYAATLLALTRDRDPGSIDLDDEAQIRYRVSGFDGDNLLAGLAGLFDLAFASGAVRVGTLHARPLTILKESWTPAFRDAFVEELRDRGVAPNRQIFFSAHQMGTAPMGADPVTSVVDPTGAVWGYENLLVADASLFPQASGVNPMLTIMALASRVAQAHGGIAAAGRDVALASE